MDKKDTAMTIELKDCFRDTLVEKLTKYISAKAPGFSSEEHLDVSFSSLGLDSADHVEITTMVEDCLQITIEPTLAFDYPTVNSLVAYLENFAGTNNATKLKEIDQ